jgi:pyridoxal phosphate enzyme (YggS family)
MAEIHQCLSIQQSLARVHERIAEAALRAGRAPEEVTLVAVSKTFPAQAVLEAIAAGQHDFGENRVEEALPKMGEIGESGLKLRWHLIGHLQSRKVKDAAGHFALIHSVDSLKLAAALNNRTANLQPAVSNPQPILLECNVSGEEAKSGFLLAGWEKDPARFEAFAREVAQISALPQVRLCGLMTVAPIVEQAAQAQPFFASLRALRDALRERFPNVAWDQLSMGMTNDFEPAIAEGATLVRIGRAIFGERTYA